VRATQVGFVPALGAREPGLDRLLDLLEGYLRAVAGIGSLSRAFLVLWATVRQGTPTVDAAIPATWSK
jgi:hypothetical protein